MMTIMSGFTPWSSLAGGALIGASASLLWLVNGRVAGISGIVAGVADGETDPSGRGGRGLESIVRLGAPGMRDSAGKDAASGYLVDATPVPASRAVVAVRSYRPVGHGCWGPIRAAAFGVER